MYYFIRLTLRKIFLMTLDDRLSSFVKLGELLRLYPGTGDADADCLRPLSDAVPTAVAENGWFTSDHITIALNAIGEILRPEHLAAWIKPYRLMMKPATKTIGVVMAGNIPAVGFHDFLCVLVSGNRLAAKLSTGDARLIPAMATILEADNPGWKDLISLTTGRLDDFDAIIATGNNNSSRYFDYYFNKYPNIIRSNRNSVALLTGHETREELQNLANDIFLYFGMGCRNVSKIFVPERFDFEQLPGAFTKYDHFCNHNKYRNNYDYMKSIFLINKVPFLDTGSLLIVENPAIASPISVLHFERYSSLEEVIALLADRKEEIQCVVSAADTGMPFVKPGLAQSPALWDYADGIDTMRFLLS